MIIFVLVFTLNFINIPIALELFCASAVKKLSYLYNNFILSQTVFIYQNFIFVCPYAMLCLFSKTSFISNNYN